MKDVIRCGVFETNSSSEHSLILIKNSDYKAWVDGKAMARIRKKKEATHTSGNFWSDLIELEFTYNLDSVNKENITIAIKHAKAEMESLNRWRKKALKIIPKNKYEEQFVWNEADQEYYDREMENYNNLLNNDNPSLDFEAYKKFTHEMWITYDEFWKAFAEEDCYSPFEHDDGKLNVHVIGKYFHS